MRPRAYAPAVFLVFLFAAPLLAHANSIPYFGPIVPSNAATCAASWSSVLQLVNNLIAFAITIAITFVAPLLIAYAGFLFVLNPINASGKEQAKSILLNTIVGICVALAGYIIVDAALTAFTYQGVAGWTSQVFVSNGQPCLPIQTQNFNQASGSQYNNGSNNSGLTNANASNVPLSSSGEGACDPTVVQQAAANGGYQISNQEAQTLACIAQPESSCGSNVSGATTPSGQPTSAQGDWQVVMHGNDPCHNLNIPVCEQVAGVSGNLNCASAFSNGIPKAGMQTLASECVAAADNTNCNAAAAACLVQANGNYSAWTADSRSSQQQSCINEYANGSGG